MIKILTISLTLSLMGLLIQVYSTCKAQTELKDYKEQVNFARIKIDSLYTELIPAQIELDRHIEALHIFMKRNRKAAEQYADIISNETE